MSLARLRRRARGISLLLRDDVLKIARLVHTDGAAGRTRPGRSISNASVYRDGAAQSSNYVAQFVDALCLGRGNGEGSARRTHGVPVPDRLVVGSTHKV